MRKITVDGIEYLYRIGRDFAVIRLPNGKTLRPFITDLTGQRPDDLERGRWKKTSDGMVTPRHIKDYLQRAYKVNPTKLLTTEEL